MLEPGAALGPRFVIEGLLGQGGMGQVYKAYDRELDRYVALKVLQPDLADDPQIIQRFKHELLLASKISHKNVLRIHDLSEADGVKFISMAFVDGEDLHHLLSNERPFPLERSLKIVRQLCEALEAAHAEDVVHRDFKPHNVLVGKDDHVYVSDFGLATSVDTAKLGMTQAGAFVGTPRYMSPEQVEGAKVDRRSDLYSLGLVFYELVTGDLPFSGDSTWQLMYQRMKEKPRDPKLLNPDLPDWVARIILHCLEKDPQNRFQSAREILADIDAQRGPSASSIVAINLRSKRTKRVLQGIAAAFLAAALFLAMPPTRHFLFKAPHKGIVGKSGLPPLSAGRFIAVLPFRVLGNKEALAYVADGLEEALSSKLFQLNDVRIASPPEASKADDQKTPLLQIAKELGANLIVHGMVQSSGDQLRIIVNLENMDDNQLQWSQEFSGVTGDLLTIEDQIYSQLVLALKLNPTHEEQARAGVRPTDNIGAYDLYLRGRSALRGHDSKSIQSALDYFNEALKQDPSFALAYSGIADASLDMNGLKKDSFWTQKALAAAQQAEQLNQQLPEVYSTLGAVYSKLGKNTEAIVQLKRAIELAPNSDLGYRRLGSAYLDSGKGQEAIQALQKAIELNPYYWGNFNELGTAYYTLGDYAKALQAFQQVTVVDSDIELGFENVGNIYLQQGKYEQAIPYFQKSLQIRPYWSTYSNLGTAYFFLKQYPNSVQMFEKAVELNPNNTLTMVNLADGYRAAGDSQKAAESYEKAISLGFKELQTNPQNSEALDEIALSFAKLGKGAEADTYIHRARTIDKKNVNYLYDEARINAVLGRKSAAIKTLKEALANHYPYEYASQDPDFQNIRDDAEFKAVLKLYEPSGN